MFVTFKILRKGFISSWTSLKLLFLWNSINMPCIAYQSIQEREPYLLKSRLSGLESELSLFKGEIDKVDRFWQKLENIPIYWTNHELMKLMTLLKTPGLWNTLLKKSQSRKSSQKHNEKTLFKKIKEFFLFVGFWAKIFGFCRFFLRRFPTRLEK